MSYKEMTADIRENQITQSMISAKKVAKWEKFGLLEGLSGKRKVHMARLLENQAAALLKESSDTTDIKGFQAVAFPMVRRVFGSLLAQEIVSVQPMALPSGLLFWMDFTYGTDKAGAGQAGRDWTKGKSIYGDPLSPLTGGADGTGGHYNLHGSYTQREATGTVGIASSASVTSWAEVDYDFELSAAVANSGLHKLTVDLDEDATITNIDATNFKDFAVSGTNAALGAAFVAYPRHNAYNPTTKVLTIYFSGTALDGGGVNSGSSVTVSYVKKSSLSADTTGTTLSPAFEYAFDDTDLIPELDLKISSIAVTAGERKLKVKWTPELAQDLNAYHSVDAEAELTQVMADQVALDIDSEILTNIVNNVRAHSEVLYWDVRPGFFVDKTSGAPLAGASFTGNVEEWFRTLMITINDASNRIFRKNLRSGANFLVTSPDVCTILESLVTWRPVMDVADTSATKFSMGVEKAGTISGKYDVYKCANFYRNAILLGYKGDEWLTTGYVYAPYIPLIVTPTIYEPDNFTPRKAVMTRYAKQIVRPDYFALVIVKGLDAF